ncbi:MAG: calcium/sodium antiporter [Planctomycetes bacterium]|nr:calcium/sodium antiporter [Planctomycetota bacterium]
MTAVWILAGLVLLVIGAEALVRGASRIALRLGVPPLVIGLTVVAFGTSAPEVGVSIDAARSGRDDVAFGNVIGSNTFNVLFILGASALVAPLVVARKLVRIDIPVMIGTSMLAAWMASDLRVTLWEGVALLALLVVFTWATVRFSKNDPEPAGAPVSDAPPPRFLPNAAMAIAGLGLLMLGSSWFVDGASELARSFGVDELTIGLTLVAAGTSLPEVATSILASIRGQRDIAIGNVVGSNIFNILGVLGAAAVAAPDGLRVSQTAVSFDTPVMLAAAAGCLPLAWTGFRIGRREGVVLLAMYLAYTGFIVLDAQNHAAVPFYGRVMTAVVLPLVVAGIAWSVARAWRRRGEVSPG